jgi:uncharacterized protein
MRRSSVAIVSFVLLATTYSFAEEIKERTITTSGESIVYAQPDEVLFQFGVETRDQSLDKAESLNDEASGKVISAIKMLGVEDKDICTDQLNVQILYVENQDLAIRGYLAARTYAVTLKDTKKFQKLVETAIKNGANRINGFEFRTKELRKYRDQSRMLAIKAAQEKATALANELQCKLGAPRTITEGGSYAGYWGGNRFANVMAQNSAQFIPPTGENDQSDALPLGQIGVQANISVTFDLIVPTAADNTP